MTSTIIIDSNAADAKKLSKILKYHSHDQLQPEGIFTDLASAFKVMDSLVSGLVFWDTSIKADQNFFNRIRKNQFELIVTSDTNSFALEAFKYNALHYLIKPLNPESVLAALSRVSGVQSDRPKNVMLHIDHLMGNIEQIKNITAPKKIVIPTLTGFELINVMDILFCQSKINYTYIHLKSKQKIIVARTLLEFEKVLRPYNFIRIHNSHLVNLAYVKSYLKGKSGTVCLTDGTFLEISSRKKDNFFKAVQSI